MIVIIKDIVVKKEFAIVLMGSLEIIVIKQFVKNNVMLMVNVLT
jgi:hypothetical protein